MKNLHLIVWLVFLVALPVTNATAQETPAPSKTLKSKRLEARTLRKKGQRLAKEAKYTEALTAFDAALKIYPRYPMVHNEIGVIHTLQGDLVQATASFRRVLKLYPDLSATWANLAHVDFQRERYGDAAQHYKAFIARRPKVADGYYGLALALAAMARKPATLWVMKQFLALEKRADPEKIQEVRARVHRLEKEGVKPLDELHLTEAIKAEQAKRAAARAKRKNRLKKHPGDHYFRQKSYLSALTAYQSALKKKPKDLTLIYKVGATYAALRDFREAVRWWERALDRAPKRSIVFEHIVLAAIRAAEHGQLDLGSDPQQRLDSLEGPTFENYPALTLALLPAGTEGEKRFERGRAALRSGNLKLARTLFEALQEDPTRKDDRVLALSLAETHLRLGAKGKARSILDTLPAYRDQPTEALLLRDYGNTLTPAASSAVAPESADPQPVDPALKAPTAPADKAKTANPKPATPPADKAKTANPKPASPSAVEMKAAPPLATPKPVTTAPAPAKLKAKAKLKLKVKAKAKLKPRAQSKKRVLKKKVSKPRVRAKAKVPKKRRVKKVQAPKKRAPKKSRPDLEDADL